MIEKKTLVLLVLVPFLVPKLVPKLVPEWDRAMAGKLRYWKEKDGRFWARMAVPIPLQKIIGKSEIIEPLGGDRRAAVKSHPAAVARLQAQIAEAEAKLKGVGVLAVPRDLITTDDFGRAVRYRYTEALEADEAARNRYPSPSEIESAKLAVVERVGRLIPLPPLFSDLGCK